LPIKEISYDKFFSVFGEYIKKKKDKIVKEHKPTDWKGDNITEIPIGNVVSFAGLMDVGGGCYQGSHPEHGSSTGANFRVNTMDNSWYCFRCQSGGGPSELIGVMEGIIDCSEAGPSCYSSDQAKDVIKLARENYGLTVPELGEPQGWAKSISILKLAEKHSLNDCPKCGNGFKFTDTHGFYYCETCRYGGGLVKFAELIKEIREKI